MQKQQLDPYQNESNWLTKQEILETKEQLGEQTNDKQLIESFDVSETEYKKLLDDEIDKIRIGENSPHFDYEIILDADPNNPLSVGGWYDTRKGIPKHLRSDA